MDPLKLTCSQQLWLHSSVGRALYRYRRGHGFESRWSLNFFRLLFRNCLNCVSTAKIFHDVIENNYISIYKLGDNTTHSKRAKWVNGSLRRPLFHLSGGGHCPLARGNEPIRLLETSTSPSLYMLIKTISTTTRGLWALRMLTRCGTPSQST